MKLRTAPFAALALAGAALLAAGCGSKGGGTANPTIAPARTFHLAGFAPTGRVRPGAPVVLRFRIVQPSGATLTRYRRGAGPHTGIHLIMVRDDLADIIHLHPKVDASGVLRQRVVFPAAGRYRIVVDVYPAEAGAPRNFQLFRSLQVGSTDPRRPLPPYRPRVTADGYTFTVVGKARLRAIEPAFLTIHVVGPDGKPPTLTPFYGALAHAIFFRAGSLDYFHTHVCAPNAAGCTSLTRAPTGRATTPGVLKAGILLPVAGTWRLFLQVELGGRIVTAPFTLHVS